jgi:hypothetical protein
LSLELITIPIGFLLLGVLLLWFIVGAKGRWEIKSVFILISCIFCFFVWESLSDITGWPTVQAPPEKFEVKWVIVNEPDKAVVGDNGSIYIWVVAIKSDESKFDFLTGNNKRVFEKQPRSHQLPYSKNAHKSANKMKEKLKKGQKVYGGTKKGPRGPKGDASNGGANSGSESHSDDDFNLYELPPPKFSPKLLGGGEVQKPLTIEDLRSQRGSN